MSHKLIGAFANGVADSDTDYRPGRGFEDDRRTGPVFINTRRWYMK